MLIGDLHGSYQQLLVAPESMKHGILRLIDQEIEKGKEGHIILKINSLTERDLIDKLSKASKAGVKIELIIRGICCLLPGISRKTKNITVRSIVGRYLEHSRVYCFGDGGGTTDIYFLGRFNDTKPRTPCGNCLPHTFRES